VYRAADTIFAGSKPFNLTNEVIFVSSPGRRAAIKRAETFAGEYTEGKNEFPRRKHSMLSHVRIVRRVREEPSVVSTDPKIASRDAVHKNKT